MKLVIQALLASIILHIIYFVCTIGIGYIKTKFYNPEPTDDWEKVYYLQNEVSFGMVISPIFFMFSLVGVAIICGIVILLYKSFSRQLGR